MWIVVAVIIIVALYGWYKHAQKKHYSYVSTRGEIKDKYHILIEQLKSLSKHYNDRGIEQFYQLKEQRVDDHTYMVRIAFVTERALVLNVDTFLIKDTGKIQLVWESEGSPVSEKLSFMTPDLPRKLRLDWNFESNIDQKIIFQKILEDIVHLSAQHNLSFPHYDRKLSYIKEYGDEIY